MILGSPITILAGENLEPYRRVRFTGTSWVYADALEEHQAVTTQYIASGSYGPARVYNDPGLMGIEASGSISAGSTAYAADDGKCSSTATGKVLGMVIQAPLAAGNPAGIIPAPHTSGEELLHSQTTPQTSDGTTTNETFFTGYSLPANTVKAGDVYRIKMGITAADQNGTDQLTARLYFGPDLINTLAAVDSVDNDIAVVSAEVTIRTIGSSGTAICVLHTQVDVDADGDPVIGRITQEFTIDTTAAINIRASSQWGGAHADNDARLDVFTVSRLRRGA